MIELDKILEGLVQRTGEGKLRWTRGAQADIFVTSVDTISVVIREGAPGYRLEIVDELGDTVEALSVDAFSPVEQDEQLKRLHVLARRSALNTDMTLEKLAKALDL